MPEAYFPYYAHSCGDWENILRPYPSNIVIHVPWGFHQRSCTEIDLVCSKRSLEKLINIVHGLKKSVVIEFGFRDRLDVPNWVWQLDEKVLVPRLALEGLSPKYSLIQVPSPYHSEFSEGFECFLEETLSLLELYREPEGPVTQFRIDLGYYRSIFSLPADSELEAELRRQFSLARFNEVFRMAYSCLEGDRLRKNLATLIERRPWIVCSFLRRAHQDRLTRWIEKLNRCVLVEAQNSFKGLRIEDDTMMVVRGNIIPYFPEGTSHPALLRGFRKTYDTLQWLLRCHAEGPNQPWKVVTDKFLLRKTFDELVFAASNGRVVYWVRGLPVYDELMEVLPTGWFSSRRSICVGGVSVHAVTLGNGSMWIGSEAPDGDKMSCHQAETATRV